MVTNLATFVTNYNFCNKNRIIRRKKKRKEIETKGLCANYVGCR